MVRYSEPEVAPGKTSGPIRLSKRHPLILLIALFSCGGPLATFGIDFTNRDALTENPSANGAVTLAWDNAGRPVKVEQSASSDFSKTVTIYQGTDRGSVVSGLREGTYFFRIREESGEWSPPLSVQVEFVSRRTMFTLLSLGGIVVVATIGAIFAGSFSTGRRAGAS